MNIVFHGVQVFMDNILKILSNWGITNATTVQQLGDAELRIVYKILTEIGTVVLKGQSTESGEEFVSGNVSAHEFLGNLHHMAPELYHLPDGGLYLKDDDSYYYLMEFVEGRQAQETADDERLLGMACARLHQLSDYQNQSTFNAHDIIRKARYWFSEYTWKNEFDKIVASIPDFSQYRQCFIHTDIGPHNAIIQKGEVVFIDLDHSGLGSPYIDLGWPFIMQFVNYNKQTREMKYQFDLATAFFQGYVSVNPLTDFEYDLLFYGATLMHISYMKSYGKDAEQPLWDILKFGIAQKDKLYKMVYRIE